MKGIIKCVIAGAIIIGIGLAIVLITLAVNGWTLKKPEFEMQSYTAENNNTEIDITVNAGSVKTEFYDGDTITIDYPTSSIYSCKISEKDGVFRYESKIKKTLFWGTINIPETTIKLPKDIIFNVEAEVNAGSIKISAGEYGKIEVDVNAGAFTSEEVKCTTFNCEVNAGRLEAKKLDCADIKAEVNAGALEININGAKADYDIKAEVYAGSCNVSNQTGSGGKKLDVECSAGSANVTFES